ncbi:CehA/McbA family metallohydrolase [Anaerocolumna sp. AGMB13020]|uniref:CehA/McbA family metallohydrolase n=1 Tax=Anaerocolumna sp. AGMB13020 TaxID=3081750 RepID=UPI0029532430|nr:CehA/McbA family metallohydrolase [Anaerocolumna sp. AGMB13020]WOO37332.1 CehA/McbA family metallohydrolase [Anaerocolumna sp. AGMB13020]
MSKESKFFSILADMAWSTVNNKGFQAKELNSSKFTELILWLEEFAVYSGYNYEEKPGNKEIGILKLKAVGEQGEGLLCQVKLFPSTGGGTPADNYLDNGELHMYREMTNEQGILEKSYPAGQYHLEITRGSEYPVYWQKLVIETGRTTQVLQKLESIVNLKEKGWYCGDLHHHSIYSSPVYGGTDPVVESPMEVSHSMRALGLTFGALSDHHNTLNHTEWERTGTEEFTPLISKEISTSNGHVMSLGVKEDMIYQIPDDKHRNDTYLREEFIRITDSIREAGGLAQINHPRDHSRAISWNPAFNDIITTFDTMEIWNGSNPMYPGTTNHKAFRFWLELLEQGIYLPATAGSDTHNILANDYVQLYGKIRWLENLIRDGRLKLPEGILSLSESFLSLCEKELMVFEKWVKCNLGSGGVRTYTYLSGEKNGFRILDSLRKGRSYLTNGPVLIPDIDGTYPGNTYILHNKIADINLKLLANRPLERINLYKNNNIKEVISLEETRCINGCFDYSFTLFHYSLEEVRWIVIQAESDCTNMAITNPIFIKRAEEV